MLKMFRALVVLAFTVGLFADTPVLLYTRPFTATGTSPAISAIGSRSLYLRLTWNPIGQPAACTVRVNSGDGTGAWSAGGAVAAQTCTTPGSVTISTAATYNYLQVDVTALTANKSVTVTLAGYENLPAGASGVSTLNCSLFPGADAGAKITACITALPSGGGVADARNLSGGFSSNPFTGITKPFTLLLGGYNYSTDVTLDLTRSGQQIVGVTQGATQIYSSASFPVSASATITTCTNATPIVCTASAAHGFSVDDLVLVAAVGGNTAANGAWVVSAVGGGGTTFTLRSSSGSGAYTAGGTAVKINPLVRFSHTASIFDSGVEHVTLNCGSAGVLGSPVAGCAGIVGLGFQNHSFLRQLYIYPSTVGVWVGSSTTSADSTNVDVNNIDAVGLVAGWEGYHFQETMALGRNLVCNSNGTVQGLACVHGLSLSHEFDTILSETMTDVLVQEASTLLTARSVYGLNHAAPTGSTTNVVRTRSGDYSLDSVAAVADGGSSVPTALNDTVKSMTIAGSFNNASAASNGLRSQFLGATTSTATDSANFVFRSGGAGNYTFIGVGRTADDGIIASIGSANQFTTGSAAGDIVNRTTGGTWWFDTNNGTGTAALKIKAANAGIQAVTYDTATNCADSAGDAACGSAAAGAFVIDAADTNTVVSTTAVTADSEIFIQEDSSLNTRLSVTCNTTIARTYAVTARSAGTSFTVTASAAPVTNPSCLTYKIVN